VAVYFLCKLIFLINEIYSHWKISLFNKYFFLSKVFGIFGIVWFFIWILVSSNNPSENRFIRHRERDYIEEQTRETMEAFKESEKGAPWLKILTSPPAAAIFFGHSCSNWGTYLFLTSLPTYMKEVLKFDVKSV